MSETDRSSRKHVLDPVERMSEVLFGLIMVLSFTGSMSAATAGREEVRAVLVGAIGCNLAWGLVDAVMYMLSSIIERTRRSSLLRRIKQTESAVEARQLIIDTIPEGIEASFSESTLDSIADRLKQLPEPPPRTFMFSQDLRGALAVFLLVFLSTFPVVIPFMIFEDLLRAMRWSNGIAVLMMFIAGYSLGKYAGIGAFRTGSIMVILGVCLVGLTVALGG